MFCHKLKITNTSRSFLKWTLLSSLLLLISAVLFVLVVSMYSVNPFPERVPERDGFLIVHMTDLHVSSQAHESRKSTPLHHKVILGGYKLHRINHYYSKEVLNKAVNLINNRINPDLVVISGDLADSRFDNVAYEYIHQKLQSLSPDYSVVLGDHDLPADQNTALAEKWFTTGPALQQTGPFRVIELPPYPTKKDMAWLKKTLDQNSDKEIIINHHRMLKASPLMNLLSKIYVPSILSPKNKEILELIESQPHIRLVLTGHSHTNYTTRKNGKVFITTSSLAEYPFEIRLIWLTEEGVESSIYSVFSQRRDMP